MSKRRNLVTGAIAGAITCALILACNNNTNSLPPAVDAGPTADSSVYGSTPPGTTPVASAPYAVCTTLEPGSFTTADGGSFAVPPTTSCNPAGEPAPVTAADPADSHCVGVTPQTVNGASCSIEDAGPTPGDDAGPVATDAGTEDAGTPPTPGPCDENGVDGAYGYTQYGTEADDDDCKYHVTYTASPICENNGTYFVVTANYLTRNGAPLTGASTFAEICLSSTHPSPTADARPPYGNQEVVEGPPGTYTIGPVLFDAPGNWTVRFHFNEFCCDVADDSPHGHAAFFVTVP